MAKALYYSVTLDDETYIVRARNTTQVKHHIMEILKKRYKYVRVDTDDVIAFMESGEDLVDLTGDDDSEVEQEQAA